MAQRTEDESSSIMNNGGTQFGAGQDLTGHNNTHPELNSTGASAADLMSTSAATVNGNVTNPPLPSEAPPQSTQAPPEDDGWDYGWSDDHGRFYFFNRYTNATQWDNPRQPENTEQTAVTQTQAPAVPTNTPSTTTGHFEQPGAESILPQDSVSKRVAGGYNPKIHGNFDPNADYAIQYRLDQEAEAASKNPYQPYPTHPLHPTNAPTTADPSTTNDAGYTAKAHFNRFTNTFQQGDFTDKHSDANKSKRQMNHFFDVDAAGNAHDGRSLKQERREQPVSGKQMRRYKRKKEADKVKKRRAKFID